MSVHLSTCVCRSTVYTKSNSDLPNSAPETKTECDSKLRPNGGVCFYDLRPVYYRYYASAPSRASLPVPEQCVFYNFFISILITMPYSERGYLPQETGDFQRARAELWEHNAIPMRGEIYGMDLLGDIHASLGGPQEGVADLNYVARYVRKNPDLSQHHERIEESRSRLTTNFRKPQLWYATSAFFAEILQDSRFENRFRQYFPKGTEYNQQEIPERTERLSDSVYLELMLAHIEVFYEKSTKFRTEQAPRLKQEYWRQLRSAVADGLLPVDLGNVRAKFDAVQMHLQDVLAKPLPELYGEYDDRNGRVYVAEQSSEALARDVSSHELTHVIEGNTPFMYSAKSHIVPLGVQPSTEHPLGGVLVNKEGEVGIRRSGLARYSPELKKWQYQWLSEAETETVSRIIRRSTKPSLGYRSEMELRKDLLVKGTREIPEVAYHRAYFENYQSRDEVPDKHFHELMDQFDGAYYPGFLADVDAAVDSIGTQEVRKLITADWRMIKNAAPRK